MKLAELEALLKEYETEETVIMTPLLATKITNIDELIEKININIPIPQFSLALYLIGRALENVEGLDDYKLIKDKMYNIIDATFTHVSKTGK